MDNASARRPARMGRALGLVSRLRRRAPPGARQGVGTSVVSGCGKRVGPRQAWMSCPSSLAAQAMDDERFQAAYRELEARMKVLAEADGDVFLPNPEPSGPVEYVFVCMEPSLGRWARSADEARAKVKAGFRNFISSIETIILHYCIRQYLCEPTEQYHITDLSKGAMLVKRAGVTRTQRYDRWYGLLLEESGPRRDFGSGNLCHGQCRRSASGEALIPETFQQTDSLFRRSSTGSRRSCRWPRT